MDKFIITSFHRSLPEPSSSPTALQEIAESHEPQEADVRDDDDDDDGEVAVSDMSEEEGDDRMGGQDDGDSQMPSSQVPLDDSQMPSSQLVVDDDAMEGGDLAPASSQFDIEIGMDDPVETGTHDGNSQVVQGESDVPAPGDDSSDVELVSIKDSEEKRSEAVDVIKARQDLEDKLSELHAMLRTKQNMATAKTFGLLLFVAC